MHLKNNKYLSRLLQLSYVMAGYRYFVCPVEFNNDSNRFTVDCEPSELFQLQDYGLPSVLQSITGWVKHTLTCTQSVRHLLLMSLIWSVLCFFLPILCLCLSQPFADSPVNVSQLCFTVTVNILWTTKTQHFNRKQLKSFKCSVFWKCLQVKSVSYTFPSISHFLFRPQ